MATIADAHIYFWVPFHGHGPNYVVGQNSFDEHGPGSRCKRTTIKNSGDTNALSDVAYATRGITSGALRISRTSDIGMHYYDIKHDKIQSLAPESAETFTFWFQYSSSPTQIVGSHCLIATDTYSVNVTFDQTSQKAQINGKTIEPNVWYHITITHEIVGNYINEIIYFNGGTDGRFQSQISKRVLNSDNLYLFGKGLDATNTPFYTYYISDFRWYGLKLTEEEILEKGTDRLILHYILDHLPRGTTVSNCSRAALYDYHIRSHLEDSETPYHYQLPPSIYSNDNTINAPYEKSWHFKHSSEYYFLKDLYMLDYIGGTTKKTICIWYKAGSYGLLFAVNENNYLGLNSSKGWIWRYGNGGGNYELGGRWGTGDSKFHHVAVVLDYNKTHFYWDGELKKTISWSSGGMSAVGELYIGYNDIWGGSQTDEDGAWRGEIADFRMYAKSLSQEEIQTLAQHPGVHLGLKNNNLLYAGDLIEEDMEQVEVKPGHRTIRVKDFIETESNETPSVTKNGTLQGVELYEM